MPLKSGSSDDVVQENIRRVLSKEAGYDPPYKDPARDVYTPPQAAAIAYAKAGRRNNVGKGSSKNKSKTSAPKSSSDTKETKPEDKKESKSSIKVPDGWKVQGDNKPKQETKASPIAKEDNKPKEDKVPVAEKEDKSVPQSPSPSESTTTGSSKPSTSPTAESTPPKSEEKLPDKEFSKMSDDEVKSAIKENYKKMGMDEGLVDTIWPILEDSNGKEAVYNASIQMLKDKNNARDIKFLDDNLNELEQIDPSVKDWYSKWQNLDKQSKKDLIEQIKKIQIAAQQKQQDDEDAQENLQKKKAEEAVELDFNLADDKYTFNINKFHHKVDDANSQLKNIGNKYGDPEPLLKLSDEQKYALREYSGDLYDPLNKFLRGTKTTSTNDQFLEQVAGQLDSALESLPDAQKGVYYRMNGINLKRREMIDQIKNLQPGDVYQDNGYGSYTSDDSGDVMSIFYREDKFSFIFKYKGSKLKNVAPISQHENEYEHLSARKQKFRVTKKETIDKGNFYLGSGTILMITLEDA